MERIAVLTSGGDAPGMNAAIRAVTRKGLYHGFEVYGVLRGYQGLINGDLLPMQLTSVGGIINQGGTVLKTARSEAFKTEEGFSAALRQIEKHKLAAVVVIGGDGSMAGAQKLAASGVKTIVIPATIDNDMAGTEYTLGFDTALNGILEATSKIRDTAESHERVAIIEVMGRHSGQLALAAGLAGGAEIILLPEVPMSIEEICHVLRQGHKRGKQSSIVIVAEGAGKGYDIAREIAAETGYSTPVTVLGYIQRGGSPTAVDNLMGSRMGGKAIDSLLAGEANCLVAVQNAAIVTVPFAEAFRMKRSIDRSQYELARILAL
ncbi:MAG: 6-phosphofructokinase [Negativicutes bacterium]|nr:6-phosphofructokinase [Negativicutes bacterium]